MLVALRQPLQLGERTLSVSASIGIAPLQRDGQALNALQAADRPVSRQECGQGPVRPVLRRPAFRRPVSWNWRALAQALTRRNSPCIISRSAASSRADPMSSASRRCCAGASTTSQWRRTSSFRCWRSRARSSASASGCCARPAAVRRWQQAGQTQLYCAVNLSIRQLQQPGFTDLLARVLRETGLRPDSLLLEITETLLMQDSEATMSSLHEIAALGVRPH